MSWLELKGGRLFYELKGNSSSHTIVFLNGLFQGTDKWVPILPFLKNYQALTYDMRGQGKSEGFEDEAFTADKHCQDLRALIDHLGFDSFSLVGLSNGGIVAQKFAIDGHARLKSLFLACTTAWLDTAVRAKVESWKMAVETGGILLTKLNRICESFGAKRYKLPTNSDEIFNKIRVIEHG